MINIQQDKKYGIMLSGGIDSAVLMYFVLESFKLNNMHSVLQPFTIPKTDGATLYVGRILEYMRNKFDKIIPDPIIVGNPTLHHAIQGSITVIEIKSKYKSIDHLFFGSNKIPPVDLPGIAPKRIEDKSGFVITPFWNFYKTEIIKLAIDNNLQELFDITHTCTEQQVGRCNLCWQCQERAWAFSSLNQIDTGNF